MGLLRQRTSGDRGEGGERSREGKQGQVWDWLLLLYWGCGCEIEMQDKEKLGKVTWGTIVLW